MSSFILSFLLFLLVNTQQNESQRFRLGRSLMELISMKKSEYLNAPTQNNIHNANYFKNLKYKYIFDCMKENEIEEITNRYGFSEKVAEEIKSTRENWITEVIDDSKMDVPKFQDEKYIVFKLIFASALKENDNIYFIYLEIFFHGDLDYNTFTREQEVCKVDHCGFKECRKEKVTTPLDYLENQKKAIIYEAYYKIFKSLIEDAVFLGDQTIQLYLSNGNAIFSDDGENAAYVGEFGDIAIGPTKYLNSVKPLKKYTVYSDGFYKFSGVDCDLYCFKDQYPGQMVHKYSMVLNKINPTSTVYTHREQMKKGEKEGPYSLILYNNGELSLYKNENYNLNSKRKNIKSEIIWSSNTKDKGIAPYKIKLSKDNRLQLLDAKNTIIYQSKEYINIPTIKYRPNNYDSKKSFYCDHPYSYNGYNFTHIPSYYYHIGIQDESYPDLQLDFYYKDGQMRWIKTKKQFTYIYQPTIHVQGAKALKMMLTGPGSEKFKVCYCVAGYLMSRKPSSVIRYPIVCDGTIVELDKNNPEMVSSLIAFITLKTDRNPQ